MSTKNDFSKIFRESFKVPAGWSEWFLNDVYCDEDLVSLQVDDRTVSVLLMSPYTMSFHGRELPAAYFSCVATARAERGKGYMRHLMINALHAAEERGYAFATLIPETHRLYFFYDRFGFSTVFYRDEQRYTSLHIFTRPEDYEPVEPAFSLFESLERLNPNCLLHTRRDFEAAMHDLKLDGGIAVAVRASDDSAAMAFATTGNVTSVKALYATDDIAAEAALELVRAEAGEKPLVVMANPGDRTGALKARGMLRIIDVESVLTTLAEAYPRLKMTIKVSDDILARNNGIYIIEKGRCSRVEPESETLHLDLDVSVKVLAGVLFSSPAIAEIFNLPPARPIMNLMLD